MSICGGLDKPCATCCYGDGGCLAGWRDDDYVPAEKDTVIERLDNGRFQNYRREMKEFLMREYLYHYDMKQTIKFE